MNRRGLLKGLVAGFAALFAPFIKAKDNIGYCYCDGYFIQNSDWVGIIELEDTGIANKEYLFNEDEAREAGFVPIDEIDLCDYSIGEMKDPGIRFIESPRLT